ncbi:MAG: carbohydrate-binding family 9-like protein [Verrucomicrobiales bacterium]
MKLMPVCLLVGMPCGFCLAESPATESQPDDPPKPAASGYLSDWRTKMLKQVPRGYVCSRAVQPLTIDGKLDEASWAAAPWTDAFVDIEGDAKPRPHFRTRAKMLWDDTHFYIAADLEEPHVWGTLTEHDSVIFQDPDFEVFIDPDSDSHEYYEFEMNALNTGWDLFLPKPYKDGGPAMNEWEIPGLKTAVHVRGTLNNPADRDDGWSVEIAIPWKVLSEHAHRPAPPAAGDQWRIGFSRVQWQIDTKDGRYTKVPGTPENNWVWSPQGVVDMHRPERWGYVQFIRTDPGTEPFVPDVSALARDALQEVYYAQKDYQTAHGGWADSLEALGLQPQAGGPSGVPELRPTADGYECQVDLTLPDGSVRRWSIRHDSLIKEVKP